MDRPAGFQAGVGIFARSAADRRISI